MTRITLKDRFRYRFDQLMARCAANKFVKGIERPMVYHVSVKYTLHQRWENEETKAKNIHCDYEFHKDSYGGLEHLYGKAS